MKRTHKMLVVMGLALPVLYFGSANEAAAYCIHNWTDTEVKVGQSHGGTSMPFKGFVKSIKPGEKACCSWQTHDCNTKGTKHAKVKLNVWYFFPMGRGADRSGNVYACEGFKINANGKLIVHGSIEKLVDGDGASAPTCKKE